MFKKRKKYNERGCINKLELLYKIKQKENQHKLLPQLLINI